jgi:DNA-binding CsgD family transcriptional regulator
MAGARTRQRVEWSPREREVLDLIAAGRTNGEIAEALGISFATAKWHVSELLSKLGVSSREEVAEHWRQERRLRRRLAGGLKRPGAGSLATRFAAVGACAAALAVSVPLILLATRSDGTLAVNSSEPGDFTTSPLPTPTAIAVGPSMVRAASKAT